MSEPRRISRRLGVSACVAVLWLSAAIAASAFDSSPPPPDGSGHADHRGRKARVEWRAQLQSKLPAAELQITFSGTLKTQRQSIRSGGSYSIRAEASGPDVSGVVLGIRRLESVDGIGTTPWEYLPAGSYPAGSSGPCAAGSATCTRAVRANPAPGLAGREPGLYEIAAYAHTETGVTRRRSFELWLDYPYFGFNDSWHQPEWVADAAPTGAFEMAAAAGANAARLTVPMGQNMEKDGDGECTGAIEWKPRFTDAYERLISQGMRPIILLTDNAAACDPAATKDGRPAPAGGCTPTAGSDQPRAYQPADTPIGDRRLREFAAALSRRFDQALAIEVFNEPNIAASWSGCAPDPARYKRLLTLASAGINGPSGNPSMPVVAAAMAPASEALPVRIHWKTYLRQLSASGRALSAISDVAALHPYLQRPECATSAGASAKSQIAAARRIPGMPSRLWVTEVGISTTGDDVDDCLRASRAVQAAGLADLYEEMRSSRVPVAIFESFADKRHDATNPFSGWEKGLGVVTVTDQTRTAFIRKPAYCALRAERAYPC